jgi:group I intron endonuclease
MNNSGIYKIVNLITGKYYVGSTKSFETRKTCHFSRLRNNNHTNKHLQNAYNKYGADNFKFEIVEYVEENLLLDIEQSYLDNSKTNDTYNKTQIAGAGGYDNLLVAVYVLDLSGNIINEYPSISEASRNLNTYFLSQICNKDKILKSKYRIVHKEFYHKNINKILKWKNYTRKDKERSRLYLLRQKVIVIKDNKTIEFNNQKEAADYLNITRERVRQILKSNSKKFEIKYKYPELQK